MTIMSDAPCGEVFEFAGFVLDTSRRRLLDAQGRDVALKPRAFDTLAHLVAHPGQVVDKHTLLDAIWPGVVVEENNLTQAISALRRALGDSRDEPRFIVTIPGRGYQLVTPVTLRTRAPAPPPVSGAKPIAPPGDSARPGWLQSRRQSLMLAGVAALAATALVVALWTRAAPTGSAAVAPAPSRIASIADGPSIAVLPFVDMSAAGDQAYFADGIAEEILNQLAGVEDLRVIARTSSFVFRGANVDARTVGATLAVTHLLQGSVRKGDDRFRISAQLVRASDGAQVWSKTYDRRLGDMFAVQDEIAASIASALSVTLGVSARRAEFGETASFEAYDHFLRGLRFANSATSDDYRMAAEEYGRALEIDPAYARAWAERAIALSTLLVKLPPDAAEIDRAREDATARALELAPELPVSQVAKMWLHADRREWVEADKACAAVFVAPPDPRAQWICGGFLNVTGRSSRALPYREAGRRADPLSATVARTVARQYLTLDMEEELAREYERAQGLSGDEWELETSMLAHLAHEGASAEELLARLEPACRAADAPSFCDVLVEAARSPQRASGLLRELLETLRGQAPAAAREVALWAAAFGDRELTLDALEVFAPATPGPLLQGLWYPIMSEARADPRFKQIVLDIGFLELWRSTGDWPDYCRPVGEGDFECY